MSQVREKVRKFRHDDDFYEFDQHSERQFDLKVDIDQWSEDWNQPTKFENLLYGLNRENQNLQKKEEIEIDLKQKSQN